MSTDAQPTATTDGRTAELPTVTAHIADDGAARITVGDVTHHRPAGDPQVARQAVVTFISQQIAAPSGRGVRADVQDPDGHWPLVVYPDGNVQVLEIRESRRATRRRHGEEQGQATADQQATAGGPDPDAAGDSVGTVPDDPAPRDDRAAAPLDAAGPADSPEPPAQAPSAADPDTDTPTLDRTGLDSAETAVPPTDATPDRPENPASHFDYAIPGDPAADSGRAPSSPRSPAGPASSPTPVEPAWPAAPTWNPEWPVAAEPAAAATPPGAPPPPHPLGATFGPGQSAFSPGRPVPTGFPAPAGQQLPPGQPAPGQTPWGPGNPGQAGPPPAQPVGWPVAPGHPAATPPGPAPASAPPGQLPTLESLLATRTPSDGGPAQWGWQANLRRMTGGLIRPKPGLEELRHREAVASVQRSMRGPRTVVVVNPKGGAHKTTATLLIAATFGIHRGGYTLAWDNNETRGTLGWRATQARHTNTAVDLLRDLDRFEDAHSARVGDLDNYVRSQGNAQFDVLASDEDAASAASIDGAAFNALHRSLSRFYRVLVVDTGNNMRASNWQAAIASADQLVIVSTVREDTAQSAAWLIDALRSAGHGRAVQEAVTILSAPARDADRPLTDRLHQHFNQLTRAVVDVPHDPALVAGGPLNVEALSERTREAWLYATAAIAEGL